MMTKLIAVLIATAFVASSALAQTSAPAGTSADPKKDAPKEAAKAAPKEAAKAAPKDDKKALQKSTQDKYMKRTPAAGSSAARIPPPTSEATKMQPGTPEQKAEAIKEYQKRSSPGQAYQNPTPAKPGQKTGEAAQTK
jgi:hypothetical protein